MTDEHDLIILIDRAYSIRHPNVKWTKAETERSWAEWDKWAVSAIAREAEKSKI